MLEKIKKKGNFDTKYEIIRIFAPKKGAKSGAKLKRLIETKYGNY
jgi:hypothetical protein